MELTLSLSGYRVLSTESAIKASEIIENRSDTIHLLITDFALPFMNGAELAARFRRARPGAKVLYISGFQKQEILEWQGKNAKVAGEFLQKPFTPEALEEKIRELLEDAA
jgi:DNA-binding NtrC family response regulator